VQGVQWLSARESLFDLEPGLLAEPRPQVEQVAPGQPTARVPQVERLQQAERLPPYVDLAEVAARASPAAPDQCRSQRRWQQG
jgi:hypothetical protein